MNNPSGQNSGNPTHRNNHNDNQSNYHQKHKKHVGFRGQNWRPNTGPEVGLQQPYNHVKQEQNNSPQGMTAGSHEFPAHHSNTASKNAKKGHRNATHYAGQRAAQFRQDSARYGPAGAQGQAHYGHYVGYSADYSWNQERYYDHRYDQAADGIIDYDFSNEGLPKEEYHYHYRNKSGNNQPISQKRPRNQNHQKLKVIDRDHKKKQGQFDGNNDYHYEQQYHLKYNQYAPKGHNFQENQAHESNHEQFQYSKQAESSGRKRENESGRAHNSAHKKWEKSGGHYKQTGDNAFQTPGKRSQRHNNTAQKSSHKKHNSQVQAQHSKIDYSSIPSFYFQELSGNSDGTPTQQIQIPIKHPKIEVSGQPKQICQFLSTVQEILFQRADEAGQLLIEKTQFEQLLGHKMGTDPFQSSDPELSMAEMLSLAESNSIIQITTRNFSNIKTVHFVSLKLEIMSFQCLEWVLLSLRQDEMTPSERAIQSRIKEAFAYKIETEVWIQLMSVLRNKKLTVINEASNLRNRAEIKKSKLLFDMNNEQVESDQLKDTLSQFELVEIEDDQPMLDSQTTAIFLTNKPKWLCIDQQNLRDQQNFKIDHNLYKHLQIFLFQHFQFQKQYHQQRSVTKIPSGEKQQESAKQKEQGDSQSSQLVWCSSISNALTKQQNQQKSKLQVSNSNQASEIQTEHSKNSTKNQQESDSYKDVMSTVQNAQNPAILEAFMAIPGGRYGCAQFVKSCGPDLLAALSLGRLAHMVQQAVSDDLLRYHKTLLIWTNKIQQIEDFNDQKLILGREELDIKQEQKLIVIKEALVQILREHRNGISLAQLPQYLKKRVPFQFNIQQFGFPKLKDLILQMSDRVNIHLKGQNHPYASLITEKDINYNEKNVEPAIKQTDSAINSGSLRDPRPDKPDQINELQQQPTKTSGQNFKPDLISQYEELNISDSSSSSSSQQSRNSSVKSDEKTEKIEQISNLELKTPENGNLEINKIDINKLEKHISERKKLNTDTKKIEPDDFARDRGLGAERPSNVTFHNRQHSDSNQQHQYQQAAMSLNWTLPNSNLHKIVIQDEQKQINIKIIKNNQEHNSNPSHDQRRFADNQDKQTHNNHFDYKQMAQNSENDAQRQGLNQDNQHSGQYQHIQNMHGNYNDRQNYQNMGHFNGTGRQQQYGSQIPSGINYGANYSYPSFGQQDILMSQNLLHSNQYQQNQGVITNSDRMGPTSGGNYHLNYMHQTQDILSQQRQHLVFQEQSFLQRLHQIDIMIEQRSLHKIASESQQVNIQVNQQVFEQELEQIVQLRNQLKQQIEECQKQQRIIMEKQQKLMVQPTGAEPHHIQSNIHSQHTQSTHSGIFMHQPHPIADFNPMYNFNHFGTGGHPVSYQAQQQIPQSPLYNAISHQQHQPPVGIPQPGHSFGQAAQQSAGSLWTNQPLNDIKKNLDQIKNDSFMPDMNHINIPGSSHDGDNSSDDLERNGRLRCQDDSNGINAGSRRRQTWSFDPQFNGDTSLQEAESVLPQKRNNLSQRKSEGLRGLLNNNFLLEQEASPEQQPLNSNSFAKNIKQPVQETEQPETEPKPQSFFQQRKNDFKQASQHLYNLKFMESSQNTIPEQQAIEEESPTMRNGGHNNEIRQNQEQNLRFVLGSLELGALTPQNGGQTNSANRSNGQQTMQQYQMNFQEKDFKIIKAEKQ